MLSVINKYENGIDKKHKWKTENIFFTPRRQQDFIILNNAKIRTLTLEDAKRNINYKLAARLVP